MRRRWRVRRLSRRRRLVGTLRRGPRHGCRSLMNGGLVRRWLLLLPSRRRAVRQLLPKRRQRRCRRGLAQGIVRLHARPGRGRKGPQGRSLTRHLRQRIPRIVVQGHRGAPSQPQLIEVRAQQRDSRRRHGTRLNHAIRAEARRRWNQVGSAAHDTGQRIVHPWGTATPAAEGYRLPLGALPSRRRTAAVTLS